MSRGRIAEGSFALSSKAPTEDENEVKQRNELGVPCKRALEAESNSILRDAQARVFISRLVGNESPIVGFIHFQMEAAEYRILDEGCPQNQIQNTIVAQLLHSTRRIQAAVWADDVQVSTGEVTLSFAHGSFGTSCRIWRDEEIGALFAHDIDVTQVRLPFPGHITDTVPSWQATGVKLIVIDVHEDEVVNLYLRLSCTQDSVTDFEDVLISPKVPISSVRSALASHQVGLLPGVARSFMVTKFDFNISSSIIV